MTKLQVIIVSDFTLFRQGLRLMLQAWTEFTVEADLGWDPASIRNLEDFSANIVIADLDNPGCVKDLIQMTRKLKTVSKVVGIWSEYRKGVISQLDIDAYHSKFSGALELRQLLNDVAAGKILKKNNSFPLKPDLQKTEWYQLLTTRELEICTLVSFGCTSREIAADLSLSIKTIETHRYHILKKLRFANTRALVNFLTSANASPGIPKIQFPSNR